jgi:hypothetical protein
MQSLDEGGELDPRRKSTPKKINVHVSNSPAFRKANRDALAAIKKTVARLKSDMEIAEKNGPKR